MTKFENVHTYEIRPSPTKTRSDLGKLQNIKLMGAMKTQSGDKSHIAVTDNE